MEGKTVKRINKWCKKWCLVLVSVLAFALLVGCGVSDSDKEKLFRVLKKENFIDVGDTNFGDYTTVNNVSNAPVPGYSSYYIYDTPDRSYHIHYDGYKDEEYDKLYRVSVEEITDDVRNHVCYYFCKSKILKKMELVDKKYSYFEKEYGEQSPYGIKKFRQSGSNISVIIPKESDTSDDELLFDYVKEILTHPGNIPEMVCNIGGEDYEAEDVQVYESGDEYVISGEVEQAEVEELVSWQFGEVFLEVR